MAIVKNGAQKKREIEVSGGVETHEPKHHKTGVV
jgi:hypothetical protein